MQNVSLPLIATPRVNQDFALNDVSSSFPYDQLRNLKGSKESGLDGIPARLLKDGASAIAKPNAYLINLTISGEIPSEWKEAKVIHIFKSDKRNEANNYLPISVLPLISKKMERIQFKYNLWLFLKRMTFHPYISQGFEGIILQNLLLSTLLSTYYNIWINKKPQVHCL